MSQGRRPVAARGKTEKSLLGGGNALSVGSESARQLGGNEKPV
ncbi:MAG: hypothetical protein WBO24_13980 [Nitrospirales bacterium]